MIEALYLPLDQIPFGAYETSIGLSHTSALADAGIAGLTHCATGVHNRDTRALHRSGVNFLKQILRDIELYKNGTNVWGDKVHYDPRPIFRAYANTLPDSPEMSPQERLTLAIIRLEEIAHQLKTPLEILSQAKHLHRRDIEDLDPVGLLEKLIHIADPYLNAFLEKKHPLAV